MVTIIVYTLGLTQPEALIVSVAGGAKLLHSTQQLYMQQHPNPVTKVTTVVMTNDDIDVDNFFGN